ncbi:ABC transporter permease, partial [Actinomadura miaoliensis]|uniref:ABC transporter permease n=1 Tax=Actinomadura miaoliensis TaxID=430685 RepID=UPI0031E8C359
ARPAAALAGALAVRLRGAPGVLARDGASRSPHRTAGAATALMAGIGVVTLLTVFAGSLRASLEDGAAGEFRGGLVVDGGTGGLDPRLTAEIAALPQVEAVAEVRTRWALDSVAFVRLAPGAAVDDAERAITALARPYGAPPVQERSEYVAAQTADVDGFLGVVYAMLALAIVTALPGIAGTLGLGVHERAREIGLLRAVGATRAQVRAMVRWEALIVALFGTAGGAGLGLFAGWALTGALEQPFAVPPARLAAIALAGAAAPVAAALLPARRASRLTIRDAVSG